MFKTPVFITSAFVACAMLFACGDDHNNNVEKPDTPTPDTPAETGDVRVLTTTSNRSKDLQESWISFSKTDNMAPSTVRLLPNEEFQTMDGFGAAITGSTCYNLMQMKPADREEFLKMTFSPENGYNADVTVLNWVGLALVCFVLPAVLSFVFNEILRKLGIVKDGYMKLPE